MVIAIKRLFEWMMLFIFFFLLTIMLYRFVLVLGDWVSPIEKSEEPIGRSIKVVEMSDNNSLLSSKEAFIKRLKFFYWVGE